MAASKAEADCRPSETSSCADPSARVGILTSRLDKYLSKLQQAQLQNDLNPSEELKAKVKKLSTKIGYYKEKLN